MQNVAIYGAGGLGRELAALMEQVNKETPTWNLVGFFDDGRQKGSDVSHFGKVLGGAAEVNALSQPLGIIIGVGSPKLRKTIREKITNPIISFPNFIFPDFYDFDPDTFHIGQGNIISRGCTATVNVTIGNFNLFNGDVVLSHDDVVGDYNVLMPDARVSGEVTIGDCNLLGSGSIVIQQMHIGNNVRLGAGSVLMTKPRNGNTYIGVPAKIFKY